MTIKVLAKSNSCLPHIIKKGDWIDLCNREKVILTAPFANTLHWKQKDGSIERRRKVQFQHELINLGVAMQLPEGFEAVLVPRSSTFRKYGILQTNSIGVIDSSYNGDGDEWALPVLSTTDTVIPEGTRIAQFRIQLSQKATLFQKLKWFFSRGVTIKRVKHLDNTPRGGFGSTD